MSDPLKELLEILREGKIRPLLWFCPKGCGKGVTWRHKAGDKSIPSCDVCGEVGDPQ